MMDKRHEMIARRAVACRAWRWEAGMLGWRAPSAEPDVRYLGEGLWWDVQAEEILINEPDDPLPDLTDPATLGCLLALVREVRNDAGFHALLLHIQENPIDSERDSRWWGLRGVDVFYSGYSWPSESAALVAALEAAP